MSFQETSDAIWNGMNGNSPFVEGKKDTGPYTADFYGLEFDANVDFDSLSDFILEILFSNSSQLFDFKQFGTNKEYWKKGGGNFKLPNILSGNASFSYKDNKKNLLKKNILVLLNRRVDYLSTFYTTKCDFRLNYRFDPRSFNITFYYANTEGSRKLMTKLEDSNEYTIEEKYIAIRIHTGDFDSLYQLCKQLFSKEQLNVFLKSHAEKYAILLRSTSNLDDLNTLYAQLPEPLSKHLVEKLSFETMSKHLRSLMEQDRDNFFWNDTSLAMLNLLNLAGAKDSKALFNSLRDDAAFIKELYYTISGNMTLGSIEIPCKFAFVTFLAKLCHENRSQGLTFKPEIFQIGKEFQPDSNLLSFNDRSPHEIFLKQYESYVRPAEWYESTFRPLGFVVEERASEKGHWYHPLDIMFLIDENAKEESKKIMIVPAIFVKYMADEREWEDIGQIIRIFVDVILLLVSIFTLGATSPLLFAFAVGDLALSSADLIISLNKDEIMQTPEGKQFLEYWDKIYLIGGLVTASPLIIAGAFNASLKLLLKAGNAETKNLIRSSLTAIIIHQNIYLKLEKDSLQLMIREYEVAKAFNYSFKNSQIKYLMENGVLFVKGNVNVEKALLKDQCFIIYDGKIIAAGDSRALEELIEKLCKLKKADLAEELKQLAQKDTKALQKSKPRKITPKKRKFSKINPKAKSDLADFKKRRNKFHNEALVEKEWSEKVTHIPWSNDEVLKFYDEITAINKNLSDNFNSAMFVTTIKNNRKHVEAISEFAISGNRNKILKELGSTPNLPDNTINVFDMPSFSFGEFSEFAVDFTNFKRKYDSEIKYIFNFLLKHVHKGDEFIIEVKTLFSPCGSCRREFLMLEDFLRKKGKKVTFIIHYNDSIKNMEDVKKLLKS